MRDGRLGVTPFRSPAAPERGAVHTEARALAAFLDEGVDDVRVTAADG
ncbi:hypothetical protein V1L54_15515 [Streptomyces sp. TRM 70361]|nr:hypothetical protein [Streptomyces sp. TRM 70361]MEE1940795.1 hypothetical protein [Streptomyces sp. TRM 70361]